MNNNSGKDSRKEIDSFCLKFVKYNGNFKNQLT